ncbi:MAG: hypothetical protein ABIT70_05165, partial [Sulfuriferula sp.]
MSTTKTLTEPKNKPAFCEGIQYFAESMPDFDKLGAKPCLSKSVPGVKNASEESATYQTLLAADALRYLTLQVTGAKSSGHPGGFA